jgi:putative ABC transport system substrate-binding protein
MVSSSVMPFKIMFVPLVLPTPPSLTRAGALLIKDSSAKSRALMVEAMVRAAKPLNVELQPIEVRDGADITEVIATAAADRVEGLVVSDHPFFTSNAAALAGLATQRGLTCAGTIEFARAGGLIGYGVNFPELVRRAAHLVDKILKGAKPGDIPIEGPTKYETVVNLKTAKALGLDIPRRCSPPPAR